jgi:O-antigen/teichoic acid export membrane protein
MSRSDVTTIGRNLSTRYLAILAEMAVGIVMLPFNLSHLGASAYGLWVLTTSVTAYFSVLDFGYGAAMVKFVAQYRARGDHDGLNEIVSTTYTLFAAAGVVTYAVAIGIAAFLGRVLHIAPDQLRTGQIVLLVTSANVAAGTAFSVYGAVINGFQRYDINNLTSAACSVAVALVNLAVLWLGGGLIALVIATTAVRVLAYAVYRANAYRVFPELQLRLSLFRRARLREVTSLSVFMLIIDWANKINYSIDAIVIGLVLGTAAVAVWSVGQRLVDAVQRLTNQLNDILFPTIVDHSAASRTDRLQALFLVGTRLSLATVVPAAVTLALTAGPLIHAWVGPGYGGAVLVVQILAASVIARVGNATSGTLLKGTERHRLLAVANMAAAAANLSLSVALARPFGLAGVAIGTLVPVTITAVFVIFPAGCRHLALPLRRAVAEAVWPALWPAAVIAAYIVVTRPLVPDSLLPVLANMTAAVCLYVFVFTAFGLTPAERRAFTSRILEMAERPRLLQPSGSEVK